MSEAALAVRVYYEDTDLSGVVYHANYLRFFERARTEWLRALGVGQDRLLRELGVVFTVAAMDVEFRAPARLDDLLEVRTRVADLRRASLVFAQTLLDPADGRLIARARVRVAAVDARRFRPVALPEPLRAALAAGVSDN